MSNLKSIVPPLELCKQIPTGEFEDSALVWVYDDVPLHQNLWAKSGSGSSPSW